MEKKKMKTSLKVMLIITIVIVGLGIIGGIGLWVTLSGAVSGADGFYMDGSDLTLIVQGIGYLGSFALALVVFAYSLMLTAIVWAVYGIGLLLAMLFRRSRKAFAVVLAVIVGVPLVTAGAYALAEFGENYIHVEKGTIASLAYNYDSDLNNRIYINENGEYVPYLVLDKKYMGEANTLLLRENVVGGAKGYTEDYNGTIGTDKIYDGQMEFDEAECFLKEEFPQRFDEAFLNAVCDTRLEFYDVYDEDDEFTKVQKFFMLSGVELGYYEKNEDTYRADDGTGNNGRPLEYFKEKPKTAVNDIGAEVPYWTRSEYYGNNCAVGYSDGWIDFMDDYVMYGVRPALAIPSDTKILKLEDSELGIICVLDLK